MRAMTDYNRTPRLHTVAVWLSLTAGMLVGCDNETLIEGQEVAASADGSGDADSATEKSDSDADGQMDVLVGTDAIVTTDLAVGTDAEDSEAGSDADPADGDAQNPDGTDATSSDVAGSDTADGGQSVVTLLLQEVTQHQTRWRPMVARRTRMSAQPRTL